MCILCAFLLDFICTPKSLLNKKKSREKFSEDGEDGGQLDSIKESFGGRIPIVQNKKIKDVLAKVIEIVITLAIQVVNRHIYPPFQKFPFPIISPPNKSVM